MFYLLGGLMCPSKSVNLQKHWQPQDWLPYNRNFHEKDKARTTMQTRRFFFSANECRLACSSILKLIFFEIQQHVMPLWKACLKGEQCPGQARLHVEAILAVARKIGFGSISEASLESSRSTPQVLEPFFAGGLRQGGIYVLY